MKKNRGKVFIGTSNVVVPGNKTSFPVEFQSQTRLHYYATLFNTVEVNQCFYKTPLITTYEKWNLQVPVNFQFSLKLSKAITHSKNLESDLSDMDRFMKNAAGLSGRGPRRRWAERSAGVHRCGAVPQSRQSRLHAVHHAQ